jgi:hypothetical protein
VCVVDLPDLKKNKYNICLYFIIIYLFIYLFLTNRYAVSSCNVSMALSILQHQGMDKKWLVETVDYGYTPLHFACESGSEPMTLALCQAMSSQYATSGSGSEEGDKIISLVAAMKSASGDMHLQKAIVQAGGKTPLHLAASKVKLLFSRIKSHVIMIIQKHEAFILQEHHIYPISLFLIFLRRLLYLSCMKLQHICADIYPLSTFFSFFCEHIFIGSCGLRTGAVEVC